jgi:uncharacterized protein YjeT (DUF2065 family)
MRALIRRFVVTGASALCVLSVDARMAVAQQEGDAAARAAAEGAFQEARGLMASGSFAAACPKLEASLALYPALGVRLNLALCYERIQRPASAWQQYREVAERDGQTRRAEFARQAAEALEPHLPRLVVRVSMDVPTPDLVVTRDGAPMEPGLFGATIYVDPGEHELRATAPGHRSFDVRVRVGMDEQVVVVVPPLQPEPTPAAPSDGESTTAPGTTGAHTGDTGKNEPLPVGAELRGEPLPDTRARSGGPGAGRKVAWVAGGSGLVLVATGLGFGLAARAAWNDARRIGLCDSETLMCDDPRGPRMVNAARARARVSSITAGAGAALLVAGTVVYWMSRDEAGDARTTRVLPTAGPTGLGLAISGAF